MIGIMAYAATPVVTMDRLLACSVVLDATPWANLMHISAMLTAVDGLAALILLAVWIERSSAIVTAVHMESRVHTVHDWDWECRTR